MLWLISVGGAKLIVHSHLLCTISLAPPRLSKYNMLKLVINFCKFSLIDQDIHYNCLNLQNIHYIVYCATSETNEFKGGCRPLKITIWMPTSL